MRLIFVRENENQKKRVCQKHVHADAPRTRKLCQGGFTCQKLSFKFEELPSGDKKEWLLLHTVLLCT